MDKYQPSKTYKLLWEEIIEDLLSQITVRYTNCRIQEDAIVTIGKKFEEYRCSAKIHMASTRLDRHKLASCICGSFIEAGPLVDPNNEMKKNANEIVALSIGMNVLKFFMMYELLKNLAISEDKKSNLLIYLKENFDLDFPSIDENICDTKCYRENMENALFRSHHLCKPTNELCHHFDIWAYSKIFYHLEVYNKEHLITLYNNYIS